MAHTNQTANYDLSQFIGTDIPNPLTDYNGDMEKIDVAIKAVADATTAYAGDITALEIQNGSEALTTTAQTLSGAVNELDADTDDLQSRMTVAEGKITADESTLATAVTNISTLAGKVSAIETQNGSEVLTTTASTLSGAVNELDSEVSSIEAQNGSETLVTTAQTLSGAINELAGGGTTVSAENVTYDNTNSELTATDVQAAIDELAEVNISIDNAMSDTSENAVQNKIIKSYVDDKIVAVTNTVGHTTAGSSDNSLEVDITKAGYTPIAFYVNGTDQSAIHIVIGKIKDNDNTKGFIGARNDNSDSKTYTIEYTTIYAKN